MSNNTEPNTDEEKCPKCGEKLIHQGGCAFCRACGYSFCDN